nr:transposase [Methylobacterium nonmethylotrophicum]
MLTEQQAVAVAAPSGFIPLALPPATVGVSVRSRTWRPSPACWWHGYAGFNGLYEARRAGGALTEAECWVHVHRKIFNLHAATGSALAAEALERIGALYGVERELHGKPPDARTRERQTRSTPLAKALRYMLAHWPALMRAFDDGRLAFDNNAAERALRSVAVGHKKYLCAGSELGVERAAAFYTLIETAKMNGLDPEGYLRDVLTRIADHTEQAA